MEGTKQLIETKILSLDKTEVKLDDFLFHVLDWSLCKYPKSVSYYLTTYGTNDVLVTITEHWVSNLKHAYEHSLLSKSQYSKIH
jgi:hypothetical protein